MGVKIGSVYNEIANFQFINAPDNSTFMDGDDINFTRLDEMVEETDERFELYHMPNNLSSAVNLANNGLFDTVTRYHYGDNEGLWTGTATAGWVHKYVALTKEGASETNISDTLRVLRKLTHGLSMLVIVPNGGLGPDFGGNLARGYGYPSNGSSLDLMNNYYYKSSDSNHPERERHFNGTGEYSDYRWRAYTSNDEYGGFYMALGLLLKYVAPYDDYIRNRIYLVIDQVASFMLDTNFLGIHATGGPTGVSQQAKFGTGGFWIPLLLKMASMCYPDKYERIYYHHVADNLQYWSAFETGFPEVISNYYAFNFGSDVTFTFLLLEGTESAIGKKFYEGYLASAWNNVKNHRNAYFNAMYLGLSNSTPGTYSDIEWDIQDQLMRMDICHFPDRYYPTVPFDASELETIEAIDKWNDFFENDSLGFFYKSFFPEVNWDETYYTKPFTVDQRHCDGFLWERNPYKASGYYGSPNELFEQAGLSLTVPYWIARAYGYLPSEGTRI